MGPHPYPWMVREFHRVIGDEAREQCHELLGGDPDVVVHECEVLDIVAVPPQDALEGAGAQVPDVDRVVR